MGIQSSEDEKTHRQKQAGCCLGYRVKLEENSVTVNAVGSYIKMKCWAVSGESTISVALVVVRQKR